jgi:TRAP-type C4-dicarboxylate transport system substrate-binding protein
MSDVPITHGISAVVSTEKALAGVSAADRAVLLEVMQRELAALTAKTRTQNEEAIAEIKKEGVQVIAVDPAAKTEFVTRGRAAWQDGVPSLYSQELLDRVKTLLADYRKSHSGGSSH